jgi:hypothetical protein
LQKYRLPEHKFPVGSEEESYKEDASFHDEAKPQRKKKRMRHEEPDQNGEAMAAADVQYFGNANQIQLKKSISELADEEHAFGDDVVMKMEEQENPEADEEAQLKENRQPSRQSHTSSANRHSKEKAGHEKQQMSEPEGEEGGTTEGSPNARTYSVLKSGSGVHDDDEEEEENGTAEGHGNHSPNAVTYSVTKSGRKSYFEEEEPSGEVEDQQREQEQEQECTTPTSPQNQQRNNGHNSTFTVAMAPNQEEEPAPQNSSKSKKTSNRAASGGSASNQVNNEADRTFTKMAVPPTITTAAEASNTADEPKSHDSTYPVVC